MMVWSVSKVVPAVLTVTVEVPVASAMEAWLTASDSVGGAWLIVTVCGVPTVFPPALAVISTVSLLSSSKSAVAVTVAVTEVEFAGSVSDFESMV